MSGHRIEHGRGLEPERIVIDEGLELRFGPQGVEDVLEDEAPEAPD